MQNVVYVPEVDCQKKKRRSPQWSIDNGIIAERHYVILSDDGEIKVHVLS
jgi:hypothetical protein